MFKLKACPRCRGDTFIDYDEYGWYEDCLQCGFVRRMRAVTDNKRNTGAVQTKTPDILSEVNG